MNDTEDVLVKLNAAMASVLSEYGYLTKWVFIGEILDKNGHRIPQVLQDPNSTTYEMSGMVSAAARAYEMQSSINLDPFGMDFDEDDDDDDD